MNKVILKGRLTKDIELKQVETNNGNKNVTHFCIAINRDKEHTDFINCVAWDKRAEFLSNYFNKGQEILLEGKLQSQKYEKDGLKTTFVEVLADTIEFCGSKQLDIPVEVNILEEDSGDDLPF